MFFHTCEKILFCFAENPIGNYAGSKKDNCKEVDQTKNTDRENTLCVPKGKSRG